MQDAVKLSLDGAWDFQIDPSDGDDILSLKEWRTVQVPMPWLAQFDDLRQYNGTAWHRRRFDWNEATDGKAAMLHFGAVDYHAIVWLNGRRVGEHEGGYLPFEFDVTDALQQGENVLVVRVVDASDDRSRYADFPFTEVPHGKQSWYGPIGGIWQSVTLELRPAVHIVAVKLTPLPAEHAIDIAATLNAALPEGGALTATVFDPAGQSVATAQLDADGCGRAVLADAPQLWSPATPALYRVETTLVAGEMQHALAATCGFRTVEARNGRIYLNGAPIYLRGVLDQAYYPGTIYTPPSLEFLEDQARKAKALGLNCLRIHIRSKIRATTKWPTASACSSGRRSRTGCCSVTRPTAASRKLSAQWWRATGTILRSLRGRWSTKTGAPTCPAILSIGAGWPTSITKQSRSTPHG